MAIEMAPARNDPEAGKPYHPKCGVNGCTANTDVVIWRQGVPVTRCAWHYTEDVRRVRRDACPMEQRYTHPPTNEQERREYVGICRQLASRIGQ